MAASIYRKSGDMIFDNNGRVAPGAKLYFYNANTTTPLTTYSDSDLTAERTHPVEADGNGRIPTIYMQYGSFDAKLTTAGGTQLFYQVNEANPAPFDDTTTFDTTTVLATGDIFFSLLNGTRTGAVRLNGRTIGNVSSSATERANDDTSDLFAYIYNSTADAQCPVSGGRGASAAVDFAASKRITLPDWRGSGPVGFDDMGNTDSTRLASSPGVTGSTTTAGSIWGANTQTISTANLPAVTPAGTVQPSGGSAGQSYTPAGTVQPSGAGAGSSYTPTGGVSRPTITVTNGGLVVRATGATFNLNASSASGTQSTVTATLDADPVFTGDAKAFTFTGTGQALTFTGTSFGSGTAHNNLARSGLGTWLIKL